MVEYRVCVCANSCHDNQNICQLNQMGSGVWNVKWISLWWLWCTDQVTAHDIPHHDSSIHRYQNESHDSQNLNGNNHGMEGTPAVISLSCTQNISLDVYSDVDIKVHTNWPMPKEHVLDHNKSSKKYWYLILCVLDRVEFPALKSLAVR